jgi:hypothetical protein
MSDNYTESLTNKPLLSKPQQSTGVRYPERSFAYYLLIYMEKFDIVP